MISVIRIYILYLNVVLIKQLGPASHYMMQVSNMFTVNFIILLFRFSRFIFANFGSMRICFNNK